MGACQTVPPQQTTKVSISPKLARLYLQKVRSENELSSEVFNPANYASDDPDGNKRYVLAYMTRKQDVDMVLISQLDRIIPDIWKLEPVAQDASKASSYTATDDISLGNRQYWSRADTRFE